MVAPLKRCQSASSTHSAVSVETWTSRPPQLTSTVPGWSASHVAPKASRATTAKKISTRIIVGQPP